MPSIISNTSWDSAKPYTIDKNIYSKGKVLQFTRKNNMMDSSDRTRRLANINLMKTINSRPTNHNPTNNSYSIKDGQIHKYNNHSNLLNITKGYYLLNARCRQTRDLAKEISDCNYTIVDQSKQGLMRTETSNWNMPPTTPQQKGIQTKFNISTKQQCLGLISEKVQMANYSFKSLNFFLHKKVKQLNTDELCQIPKKLVALNNKLVDPHIIDKDIEHTHHFPISSDDGRIAFGHYTHTHQNDPHDDPKVPPHVPSFGAFTFRFARFPDNKYDTAL